jgi:cytoskeletal protein CcmA (bactofilin family)
MADEYILRASAEEARMATAAPQGGTVGEGAVLAGKVRGQDLTVLGAVEGELQLEGRLHVGKSGRVAARVRATDVVVEGEIEGDVRASSLTLGETARARGTFVAKRLVVKEGALLEGSINPASAALEPPKAPAEEPGEEETAPEETEEPDEDE